MLSMRYEDSKDRRGWTEQSFLSDMPASATSGTSAQEIELARTKNKECAAKDQDAGIDEACGRRNC